MTPDKLLELADRIAAGTAEEQRDLLLKAWQALTPIWRPNWRKFSRFLQVLHAEAYESAAMMLVPEGWDKFVWDVNDGAGAMCKLSRDGFYDIDALASCWSLALAAAALRAHAAVGEG